MARKRHTVAVSKSIKRECKTRIALEQTLAEKLGKSHDNSKILRQLHFNRVVNQRR